MNDMKSLNQGIYFSVKKDSFQNSHPEYMKYNTKMNRVSKNIIEGFQEGATGSNEQNLKVFGNQISKKKQSLSMELLIYFIQL